MKTDWIVLDGVSEESRDGREHEPGKNEPNQNPNPAFAKNEPEPNPTFTEFEKNTKQKCRILSHI